MPTEYELEAKQAARAHFGLPSIQAFTEGHEQPPPQIAGIGIGDNVIRVYMLIDYDNLDIPDNFNSIPTQLVKTTGFHIQPTLCGVSVGHVNITAGTLGCLVGRNGQRYVLSNNHVLADVNNAQIGDRIIQPGTADGGTSPNDDIAELSDFLPIDFTAGGSNHMDAAIAKLLDINSVNPSITGIGPPATTPITATINQLVRKHGRTTGLTSGKVVDVNFDGYVNFGNGTAWFENQVAISNNQNPFSLGGDSGSLIVDSKTSKPVALLFAGDNRITLANPIGQILNNFGVTVVN